MNKGWFCGSESVEIRQEGAVGTFRGSSGSAVSPPAPLVDNRGLEDGFIQPDAVSYASSESKREVGLEIHSGQNRIVRRMFEHLGYKVVKLDRVYYAGLTKKDLPRGKWRFLNDKEIRRLKMNAYE